MFPEQYVCGMKCCRVLYMNIGSGIFQAEDRTFHCAGVWV